MSHPQNSPQSEQESAKTVTRRQEDALLQKLYKKALNNSYFNSLRTKYEKTSEEIALNYRSLREDYFLVWQKTAHEALKKSQSAIKDILYPPTMYNALLDVWFILSIPFEVSNFSKEEYIGKLMKVYGKNYETVFPGDIVDNFYDSTNKIWVDMISPSKESIIEKSLQIVAAAIALDFKLKDTQFEVLAPAVFELITVDKNHLSSFEGFAEILQKKSGKKIYTIIYNHTKAVRIFYDFAKRFYFEQFPFKFCDQSARKFILLFAKNKVQTSSELVLLRVDRALSWLSECSDLHYNYETLPVDILERLRYVTLKSVFLSQRNLAKLINWIQETRGYKKIDCYVGFKDRYNELRSISQIFYDTIEAQIYDPAVQGISIVYNKLSKQWIFIVQNVDERFLKHQRKYLFSKYHFLKDSIISLKDQVLEVRINQESLQRYSKNLREQLLYFFGEIKGLNLDKVKVIGSTFYRRALENVKKTLLFFSERRNPQGEPKIETKKLGAPASKDQEESSRSKKQETENKENSDSLQNSKEQEEEKVSDESASHQTKEEKQDPQKKEHLNSQKVESEQNNKESVGTHQPKESESNHKVEDESDVGGRPGSQTTENSSREDIPHSENNGEKLEIDDSDRGKGQSRNHENPETVAVQE